MKTKEPTLQKIVDELTRKNKERKTPYAERLVEGLKCGKRDRL